MLDNSKKLLVTHGKHYLLKKSSCHTTQNIMSSLKKKKEVKSSDIRGLLKKKKDVKEPVNTEENIDSVDTLTDSATVDFGCVSLSSQSKKDNVIEVD